MKEIQSHLFEKIERVADSVNKQLRKRGFVIPIKNKDGSVSYGNYLVVKNANGLFDIKENGYSVVNNINLIHSASILANKLALSRTLDNRIFNLDQSYGAKLVEADHYKSLAKKNAAQGQYDRSDILIIKSDDSRVKSKAYKNQVLEDFDKLLRSAK